MPFPWSWLWHTVTVEEREKDFIARHLPINHDDSKISRNENVKFQLILSVRKSHHPLTKIA